MAGNMAACRSSNLHVYTSKPWQSWLGTCTWLIMNHSADRFNVELSSLLGLWCWSLCSSDKSFLLFFAYMCTASVDSILCQVAELMHGTSWPLHCIIAAMLCSKFAQAHPTMLCICLVYYIQATWLCSCFTIILLYAHTDCYQPLTICVHAMARFEESGWSECLKQGDVHYSVSLVIR